MNQFTDFSGQSPTPFSTELDEFAESNSRAQLFPGSSESAASTRASSFSPAPSLLNPIPSWMNDLSSHKVGTYLALDKFANIARTQMLAPNRHGSVAPTPPRLLQTSSYSYRHGVEFDRFDRLEGRLEQILYVNCPIQLFNALTEYYCCSATVPAQPSRPWPECSKSSWFSHIPRTT